jgi:hypothetical protein
MVKNLFRKPPNLANVPLIVLKGMFDSLVAAVMAAKTDVRCVGLIFSQAKKSFSHLIKSIPTLAKPVLK